MKMVFEPIVEKVLNIVHNDGYDVDKEKVLKFFGILLSEWNTLSLKYSKDALSEYDYYVTLSEYEILTYMKDKVSLSDDMMKRILNIVTRKFKHDMSDALFIDNYLMMYKDGEYFLSPIGMSIKSIIQR